ncbi:MULTISPECIES: NAD(P)(+) transhydrogenase (Re/Si-specific) subunit beta [Furfurilactobacillus]|uniref:NAD(P) transhydrogenase subunit beta n=2 Tax=Furfurilactobacillus TaxID=2767882 RepID=A0A6N9I336_9LACO|nr:MULTISPECIES: NAD(P)(+) transhydrogenase (Re/Si-specific) subunit beta [Furfurilactobacillus]MCF6164956.1 NAD(P)(+) transhydrogenase (Re/Si-specific) subunit beta [Furfurilactobacillus rossiae]MYV05154.1 NAD(P)(+) transhydrogenase (Re/Si-specific) subunit beta [Furfurilactobacillus milii]MYV16763.1 NAD(P)(+) transhydrogenase (Re/Si-specific) subunit beta [Furfurilactobacillus milii]QLE63973.1 NADP transhydrogenase subunit beta [Furfurilactobacillus rossiae]
MSALTTVASLVYLISAVCYVIGVHLMRSPKTARRGNGLSAVGMFLAVIMIVITIIAEGKITGTGWVVLILGLALGVWYGVARARKVPMTDVPQLVSLFNAVGGGAAAVIGIFDYAVKAGGTHLSVAFSLPVLLDVIIGGITFSGSLIATGKLSGHVPGKPITFPGARLVNVLVVIAILVAAWLMIGLPTNVWFMVLGLIASLVFGLLMTLPIGGADMPVVVSLLNAFTGLAVAFAGFVIDNQVLIIAGALVGAAGTILTLQMADAMNRSVANILAGGFGTGDSNSSSAADETPVNVKETSADDIGLQLAYANNVMIVPGYGLAAAQAQHEVAELAKLLTDNGINVNYAIHPVAGRMPGHMNVLLADVNVPYDQMKQMEEANSMFENTDVSLVIGANDVTNPLARESGNAISGMPILDVDKSKSVVVIKRSMSTGYAGVQNPLFSMDNTQMFFSDAKKGLADIIASTKEYINQ